MAATKVLPAQVIRYSYLWLDEHRRGREEGVKDRPCVIVLVVRREDEATERVIVVPVTHTPPSDYSSAIEIPPPTKRRLGLDDLPSWIVVNEGNQFDWPGPDVRPIRSTGDGRYSYGFLPTDLFEKVRAMFVQNMKTRPAIVPRTE